MAQPEVTAALVRDALNLIAAGRFDESEQVADRLIAHAPKDANGHYFKGLARYMKNDAKSALGALTKAAKLAPGQPLIETTRGRTLAALGRHKEATVIFQRTLKANPSHGEAWLKLGESLRQLDRPDEARDALQRASEFAPHHDDALCELTELEVNAGNTAVAQTTIERAVNRGGSPRAHILHARAMLRAGDQRTAADELERQLSLQEWSPINTAVAWGLIGEARQILNMPEAAYDAFLRANTVVRTAFADATFPGTLDLSLTNVRSLRKHTATLAPNTWPDIQPPTTHSPVFLIGFPRSGTTLLDQILSSHTMIGVVEEKQVLWEAFEALRETPTPDAERIPNLSSKRVRAFQSRYRRALEGYLPTPTSAIRIDKYPLLMTWAPFIRAIWPDARFICVLRDPRDAVFSAFQQRFSMNLAMYEMLTLETAAEYYDAAMGLFHNFIDRTPCHVHTIRYEDIVTNFDATIAPLLSFLDAPWEDGVRDYRSTAKERGVQTPSAGQVVKPLYTSSINKWRTYKTPLAPTRRWLDPWAERFGYEVDY